MIETIETVRRFFDAEFSLTIATWVLSGVTAMDAGVGARVAHRLGQVVRIFRRPVPTQVAPPMPIPYRNGAAHRYPAR